MHTKELERHRPSHDFAHGAAADGERKTWIVIGLTIVTMVVEIGAGFWFGSMALLADGWHMGTHAAAFGIAAFAYAYARKHADNPRFTFGTGKVSALGGFASAVGLGIAGVLMAVESIERFMEPIAIRFDEAIAVAVLGLLVNIASAVLLSGSGDGHDHHHHHGHDHHHHHHGDDHNLKAAYMHVLADGWHMGTHAAAFGIAAFAYAYARKHADNPRFTFGTGKVSALGGFASAVGLGIAGVLMAVESIERFMEPVAIRFDEAIAVAVLGLLVNIASAVLLSGSGDGHDHHHHHGHDHHHHHHGDDHNLKAAYMHVLADALTSVLAIGALVAGRFMGWTGLDPLMGVVGAVVIAKWSVDLMRSTSRVLLDAEVDPAVADRVRTAIESKDDNRVADLHVWRVGPTHLACMLSVVTHEPKAPEHYKALVADRHQELVHLTIEVIQCEDDDCGPELQSA